MVEIERTLFLREAFVGVSILQVRHPGSAGMTEP